MLLRYRERAGLSQAALAKILGYSSPQFISNIERGRCEIPVSKFKLLAKKIKIPIRKLIEYKLANSERRLRQALKSRGL